MVNHSGLRLALLVLLAASLPIASLAGLLLLAVCLICLISRSNLSVGSWFSGLLRLRWLFISIAILYCWFTPGAAPPAPSFVPIPLNLPSYLGLQFALERSLVLAILFGSVLLCLEPLAPSQIVAGLRWLLLPLSAVGVPVRLFCDRLAATLANISEMQIQLNQRVKKSASTSIISWLSAIAERGAEAILFVEKQSFESDVETQNVTVPSTNSPRALELIFASLFAASIVAVVVAL